MQNQPEYITDLARALERQVEMQAEAAKRAIREYKKSILEGPVGGDIRPTGRQLAVEHVVSEYIQLRRRLDEVRAEMTDGKTGPTT